MTTDSSAHDSPTRSEPRSSRGARLLIALVLVLAIVASAGALAWILSQRTGEADELQSERDKVMAQSRQFMLRVNTYGPDLLQDDGTMPKYRELVLDVITPKLATSFEQTVAAAEATVSQAGVARTTEVFGTGVSIIDDDSASAFVTGSFTNSYPNPDDDTQRVDDVPLPFRVRVDLVKIDGKWLVDAFNPVTGQEETPETPETPGATPTPSPTGSGSPEATPSGPAPSGPSGPSGEASP